MAPFLQQSPGAAQSFFPVLLVPEKRLTGRAKTV
jgi:hypothetical protein